MSIDTVIVRARELVAGRVVFAEPYERDGVTVIPAARVVGGGGGGRGQDRAGRRGDGGGLGLFAAPAGAFVVRDGTVRWHPAVDVNHLVTVVGALAVTGLFALRRVVRAAR